MRRMADGIKCVKKSRTTSAVHVEIGDWKGCPNRQLEVETINRNVQNALQEVPGAQNDESGPHLRQEL